MPEKLERKKAKPAASAGGATSAIEAPRKPGGFTRGVSDKKLAQFTNQLSILQASGIPIVRSLRICQSQLRDGPLKTVVGAVADDVEGGASLSEAFAKHDAVFDRLYVNMVRAGEKGGILDTILVRLADFAEKSQRIKSKIREALTYPVVVLFFAMAVLVFVMVFIVPKFEDIFKQFNQDLPAITRLLIDASRAMLTYWYIFLGIPIVLFFVYRLALRSPKVRYASDKVKLRAPIMGDLIQKTIIARFSRTLGTLLQSGVPILEALEIVEASIPNAVLSGALSDVRASVREGETMAAPLLESRVFDDMVVNMIDVGEATGSVDKMLLKIADTYEDEVDTRVSTLFKLIEPVLLLALAVIVGFIVLALFLPILKVMDTMGAQG